MEFLGSGGVLLIVIAVLWFAFMTPSGEKSVRTEKIKRSRRAKLQKTPRPAPITPKTAKSPVFIGQEATSQVESAPEKLVINRLPDPLSARLGTLENVSWAPVIEIQKAREEKENINSESLDEILQRRRSNG